MASSQSWNKDTDPQTWTSSYRQRHVWRWFDLAQAVSGSVSRGSYFGVLVQQQSSFWEPPLFSQLLCNRKKEKQSGRGGRPDGTVSHRPPVCCHGYLPGPWPAERAGRAVAGSAAPHRSHSSNWSCWRTPAGRWRTLHIAIATGRPAPPAAAPPGARHRSSSEPGGQRSRF